MRFTAIANLCLVLCCAAAVPAAAAPTTIPPPPAPAAAPAAGAASPADARLEEAIALASQGKFKESSQHRLVGASLADH